MLQDVTYSSTIERPMSDSERERMLKEFDNMGAITKPTDIEYLLERYKKIAIKYLDNSGINYKDCDGWEWGHSLTEEYKMAAKRNGGFVAAFKILNSIAHVKSKSASEKNALALAFALHIGFYARKIVIAEMEPTFLAGIAKIDAANKEKRNARQEAQEIARPIFVHYLSESEKKHTTKNRTWAAQKTSEALKEDGIMRTQKTIMNWFPADIIP